ncbi:MAG TPA: hypothetical protein VD861_21500, partial [Pyrinomonadaceae bacterium]|nr:hypothetical protein [Pyrinomonadaceae bacterium]
AFLVSAYSYLWALLLYPRIRRWAVKPERPARPEAQQGGPAAESRIKSESKQEDEYETPDN